MPGDQAACATAKLLLDYTTLVFLLLGVTANSSQPQFSSISPLPAWVRAQLRLDGFWLVLLPLQSSCWRFASIPHGDWVWGLQEEMLSLP